MKTIIFIIISLVSGIMAGEIFAAINLFVVEPTTDRAIGYELQKDILKGQQINFNQFNSYRMWQKSGTFAAGAFIGMAYGGLMGIVYLFARKYLPFSEDDKKKSYYLSSINVFIFLSSSF